MTWLELLREKLHDGAYVRGYDDIPFLCPADMFGGIAPFFGDACKAKSCVVCWNSEVEVTEE